MISSCAAARAAPRPSSPLRRACSATQSISVSSGTLPAGVTLVSDPDMLVVNIIAAPTAEDLESEGGGESVEEQAAEAAESAAEGESAGTDKGE